MHTITDKSSLRFSLIQMNAKVGDITSNLNKMQYYLKTHANQGIDVLVFSQSPIIGYPACDLLFDKTLIQNQQVALTQLENLMKPYPYVIIHYYKPCLSSSKKAHNFSVHSLYNAYGIWEHGIQVSSGSQKILTHKITQNEFRYFVSGKHTPIKINQTDYIAIAFGEEIKQDSFWHDLQDKPPLLTLVMDSDYYELGKVKNKIKNITQIAKQKQCFIAYLNTCGCSDAFIFDGNSFFCSPEGTVLTQANAFKEDSCIYDIPIQQDNYKLNSSKPRHRTYVAEELYQALVFAKRDYHAKTGIQKSVVGVSGGIDSSVVLAIDVDAIGKDNVLAILSPSRYTSTHSINSAIQLCQQLKVAYKLIPIEEKYNNEWIGLIPQEQKRFIHHFGKPNHVCIFENQQAMDRMAILRSIANHIRGIVSGTSNKPELAMGYGTLCGDIQADIFVIGDAYKHQVYLMANYINQRAGYPIIPHSIIQARPSAELNENQYDPFDYNILDRFLELKTAHWLSDKEIYEIIQSETTSVTYDLIKSYSRLMKQHRHKQEKVSFAFKINPGTLGLDYILPVTY